MSDQQESTNRVRTVWPPAGRTRRSLLALAGLTAAAGTVMVLSATGAGAAPHATAPADKYYVCKYVGTPGDDERLQTGQNPIVISGNAIKEKPVVVGSFFNDKQGRSYVLAVFPQDPEPSASDCPLTTVTETPTPTESTSNSSGISGGSTSSEASHGQEGGSTAVSSSEAAAPIPAGVSAGLHTPLANVGLRSWGVVLMVLGGISGLFVGLWPTRRRAH